MDHIRQDLEYSYIFGMIADNKKQETRRQEDKTKQNNTTQEQASPFL
jgi:hypothetical protein